MNKDNPERYPDTMFPWMPGYEGGLERLLEDAAFSATFSPKVPVSQIDALLDLQANRGQKC